MEEWKEYKLGEIAEFRTGKLNSNASVQNGKYPFFTCAPETFFINDYAFDQKAILLAGNNAEGNFNIKYYEGKFNAYQRTYIINPVSDVVDIHFLYYALQLCLQQFKSLSQGTSTKFLTAKILNSFCIQVPSLSIQERIADVIKSLDDKIELNRRINANLEAQAQALFKSWFVDFEPFRDGEFVESELGMIPKGWRVGTIGDLAKISSGKRPPVKGTYKTDELAIPLIGASSIMGYTSDYLYDTKILVTGRVGTHGVVMRFECQCWPSDNTLVIESDYYEYVYQCLKLIDYKNLNRGSTQPLITQTDLKNVRIVIPKGCFLDDYEKKISSIMKYAHNAEFESRRLATLRDTLLPRLMSGEIKVGDVTL